MSSADNEVNYFETWPLIDYGTEPVNPYWAFRCLFKHNANGALIVWQVGYYGGIIHTRHGHFDGKIQHDQTKVEPVGGKTMEQQALQDCKARYLDKWDKDNYRTPGNAPNKVEPMCGYDIKECKIETWPVAVQEKLDGVRALFHDEDGRIVGTSRGNKPYTHLTHINQELIRLFRFLPTGAYLDGELYIHGMKFQSITSIISTGINADRTIGNTHPHLPYLGYHIFDIITIEQYNYSQRHQIIVQAYTQYLRERQEFGQFDEPQLKILSYYLVYNDEQLGQLHEHYLAQGFEGTMIRKLIKAKSNDKIHYVCSRTKSLIKIKNWITEEALIVGVGHGQGREENLALFQLRDIRGNQFNCRPSGDFGLRNEWLINPNLVLNKLATIRYQELTTAGIPRFPTVLSIRDYE